MTDKTRDIDQFPTVVALGLGDAQIAACTRAIRPVQVLAATDVRSATSVMLQHRALILITPHDHLSEEDHFALRESCGACGAELLMLREEQVTDAKVLAKLLLDALRIAERRRVGK